MTVRTSVQQAAVNALAAFLRQQFETKDIVVFDGWPENSKDLPKRAVTILLAGDRQDEETGGSYLRAISSEDIPGSTRKLYRWTVKACRQAIQLDIWAKSDVSRDDIVALLDEALHQGESVTLGIAGGNPFRDGPLLRFRSEDGHDGFIDFLFEDGPNRENSGEQGARGEFRATQHGTASCVLSLVADSPPLLVAKLKMALSDTSAPPSTTDTYTITATTFGQSTP